MKARSPKSPQKFRKNFKRKRRRFLVSWIRFAERNRNSNLLVVGFFFLLLLHGYLPIFPVFLTIMGVVAINSNRWILFWLVSAVAESLNNASAYLLGRLLSGDSFEALMHKLHWHKLWMRSEQTISHYGPYAGFIGALLGLPNTVILAVLGFADAETFRLDSKPEDSWVFLFSLVFAGYLLRNGIIAGATRFGWIQMEKRARI